MDFEEFKEQFAEDVKNDLEGKGYKKATKRLQKGYKENFLYKFHIIPISSLFFGY